MLKIHRMRRVELCYTRSMPIFIIPNLANDHLLSPTHSTLLLRPPIPFVRERHLGACYVLPSGVSFSALYATAYLGSNS
jgi:hypothetical protein